MVAGTCPGYTTYDLCAPHAQQHAMHAHTREELRAAAAERERRERCAPSSHAIVVRMGRATRGSGDDRERKNISLFKHTHSSRSQRGRKSNHSILSSRKPPLAPPLSLFAHHPSWIGRLSSRFRSIILSTWPARAWAMSLMLINPTTSPPSFTGRWRKPSASMMSTQC